MQAPLLFAFRTIAPFSVLCYVVFMLAVPCLPFTDTMNQPMAVPRWEYWLIHVSVPSTIWWRWTGGLQSVCVSDRLPVFLAALLWVVLCWGLGRLVLRCDAMNVYLSKFKRNCLAILVGQSILANIVLWHASLVGTRHSLTLLFCISAMAVGIWWLGDYFLKTYNHNANHDHLIDSKVFEPSDGSFDNSIRRRMIGMLFLSIAWLTCVQVYGASIPTCDREVRTVDWWLAKHSLLDGQIQYRRENVRANEPAGWTMSSLASMSLLSNGLANENENAGSWKELRQQQMERMLYGAVAGKVVGAILCVIAIFLIGVHLNERWGVLPSVLSTFMLIATPGIAELTRLGRTECLIGAWGTAMLCIWQTHESKGKLGQPLGIAWWCLFAGACSSGYCAAILVGGPAIGIAVWNRYFLRSRMVSSLKAKTAKERSPRILYQCLIVVAIMSASNSYVRNCVVAGDPVVPWLKVIEQQIGWSRRTEAGEKWSYAHRVRAETISETLLQNGDTETQDPLHSPYRMANIFDGVSRLVWNSNVHGLLLVPFAMLGVVIALFSRAYRMGGLATACFLGWSTLWWLFSPRFDRDWTGSLLFLAWPAASGISWMMGCANRYWLALLVTVGILWSVVVIPIWPTSDNRILVAIEAAQGSKLEDEIDESNPKDHIQLLNRMLLDGQHLDQYSKLVLVGDNDDFGLLCPAISYGPFDRSLWDELLDTAPEQRQAAMNRKGITHVVIIWSGISDQEREFGIKLEPRLRSFLDEMLEANQLSAISWQFNSSQTELYRVN